MSEKPPTELPMIGSHPMDEDTASCAPKIYVSNEEKSILAEMRELRERAVDLRRQLEAAEEPERRAEIASELDELRTERAELAKRRELAFKRKMIMLGHLPPDDEVRLF